MRLASKTKAPPSNFIVVAADPKQATTVADAIDRRFANSSYETQTDSYRDFAQQQMQQIGNLNFAIRSIVTAVLVTLLFSTATMMMQSVRERTPELAVLKTVGFTDAAIFGIVRHRSIRSLCVRRIGRTWPRDSCISLGCEGSPGNFHAAYRSRHWPGDFAHCG